MRICIKVENLKKVRRFGGCWGCFIVLRLGREKVRRLEGAGEVSFVLWLKIEEG